MARCPTRITYLSAATLLLLVVSGCSTDQPAPHLAYPDLVQGEWVLAHAYRNESETRVLDGTYFHFRDLTLVDTNLPLPGQGAGENATSPYTISADSLILQTASGQHQVFLISALDSHHLVLSTLIMDHAFRFDLVRDQTGNE